MSDNYTELYYHIVWATKDREPYLTDVVEIELFNYLATVCRTLRVAIHALNGMPDHVHLICSIPPSISISEVVMDLKGKSAYHLNHLPSSDSYLAWQPAYGVITLSKHHLQRARLYVNNQKTHHADNTVFARLERCSSISSNVPEGQCAETSPRLQAGDSREPRS